MGKVRHKRQKIDSKGNLRAIKGRDKLCTRHCQELRSSRPQSDRLRPVEGPDPVRELARG